MTIRMCILVGTALAATGCANSRDAGRWDALDSRIAEIQRDRRTAVDSAARHPTAPPEFRLAAYGQPGEPSAPNDEPTSPIRESDLAATTSGDIVSADRPGPLPGLWDTLKRDVKAMPGDLWRDTKKVYGSVPNLLILGLTYGGSLAIQETGPDKTVEDGLRGHDVFKDDFNDVFGALGNPGTHFALAGAWYLVGQQTQNDKTYNVGKKLFSALIINGASTMLGQAASWDDGPNGEWGTFPSGHTSSTFCFASVMHQEYGPLVGIPLYGLGALVAIELLDYDEHNLTDVVIGAVLGLVIGHSDASEKELEIFGGKVLPYADPNTGSTGIAWVKPLEAW